MLKVRFILPSRNWWWFCFSVIDFFVNNFEIVLEWIQQKTTAPFDFFLFLKSPNTYTLKVVRNKYQKNIRQLILSYAYK